MYMWLLHSFITYFHVFFEMQAAFIEVYLQSTKGDLQNLAGEHVVGGT